MFWYVLFVKTGFDHGAADIVSCLWQIDELCPFVPMREACFKRDVVEKRYLFPGYVFVEAVTAGAGFSIHAYGRIVQSRYSIGLLSYGGRDNDSFGMNDKEHEFFTKLYNDEHCVEMSQGFFEGDRNLIIPMLFIAIGIYFLLVHDIKYLFSLYYIFYQIPLFSICLMLFFL